jgi:hypothetical protein
VELVPYIPSQFVRSWYIEKLMIFAVGISTVTHATAGNAFSPNSTSNTAWVSANFLGLEKNKNK